MKMLRNVSLTLHGYGRIWGEYRICMRYKGQILLNYILNGQILQDYNKRLIWLAKFHESKLELRTFWNERKTNKHIS